MAEFCLECWAKKNREKPDKKKYIISKETDLCEGCGEIKPVVIGERDFYYLTSFLFLPFEIIIIIVRLFLKLFIWLYKLIKKNR